MRRGVLSVLFLLFLPTFLWAQGRTTAEIRGRVIDQEGGKPIPGATIVAEHLPTGTKYGAVSRPDGYFLISGLRVGGPYKVTVRSTGYKTLSRSGIYLRAGQSFEINFALETEAIQVKGITVVGERLGAQGGETIQLDPQTVEMIPTVTRSIQDYARVAPVAVGTNIGASDNLGGISIAGRNNRYNNFQVDGAVLNDPFGLPDAGTPGGQANAQPISIEAIEQMQISVAPFDVRQGVFTGGLINIVTRGGTNQLSGAAYIYGNNQDLVGVSPDTSKQKLSDYTDLVFGARIGGPIIRNKLFYFVNAEMRQRVEPRPALGDPIIVENGFEAPKSMVDEVINITKNQYNFNPGGYDEFQNETGDIKLFARFDLNLGEDHRLTLRNNFVNASLDRGIYRSGSTFQLESGGYVFKSMQNQTVLQLNSVVGDNMANELRISYLMIRDKRDPNAKEFPQVTVSLRDTSGKFLGAVRFGGERFSQANALDQDVLEFTDNLTYFLGAHTLTFGTHNELLSFSNLFIQDYWGRWDFYSLDDYRNGIASRFSLSYSKLSDNPKPRAEWSMLQAGVYAQDEWQVNPKFRITAGLRVDVPIFLDKPLNNPDFHEAFPQYRTDEVPSGNLLFSPRFGFNYDMTEEAEMVVRGGIGVFAGRTPGVWLSNQYSNTGMDLARVDLRSGIPSFDPEIWKKDKSTLTPIPTTEINITDPDFKLPQVLRVNLGADKMLPLDIRGSIDILYSKTLSDIAYANLNLKGPVDTIQTIDGRPVFSHISNFRYGTGNPDLVDSRFTNVLLLKNTDQGYQFNVTVQLEKEFDFGLRSYVAYTYGRALDVNSGQSSRAISNWQYNEVPGDPNNPPLATSDFEIRHRIVANLGYSFTYDFGSTTISLLYEGRSGRPFNFIYRGDANGDGRRYNDLIYVPASKDEIEISDEDWANFNAFIDRFQNLKDYRGKIIDRNAMREPWINQLDLRVIQELKLFGDRHRFQLTVDVLNFLNLLNSDWGHQQYIPYQSYQLLQFDGYVKDGDVYKPKVRYRGPAANESIDELYSKDNLLSRWRIQIGARYSF